ncbi:Transmembrane and TPR repeat-containing protein 2 [Bagarius yarrelli]|uniref:dolichyl-phosphate-mannose--protein mannosyltransferase n=1 Tax=Bagarius yarrelli TaxID=175774 RepID=A0A556THH4_BAGYA|nr:Transmembrane and TPR repeat-containing protein 2 [Bagarius yarrelli]
MAFFDVATDLLKKKLDEVCRFLSVTLRIANAHTVDFYTRDVWRAFMAVEPEEVLTAFQFAQDRTGAPEVNTSFGFCDVSKKLVDVSSLLRAAEVHSLPDVGSGKGYLCSFLSMQYSLQVFGIDCSSTNTHGAQERNRKLKKFSRAYQKHGKLGSDLEVLKKEMKDEKEKDNEREDRMQDYHRSSCFQEQEVKNDGAKELEIKKHVPTDEDVDVVKVRCISSPHLNNDAVLVQSESETTNSDSENSFFTALAPDIVEQAPSRVPPSQLSAEERERRKRENLERKTRDGKYNSDTKNIYSPLTSYVTAQTELRTLITELENAIMVGLHTCGDLAPSTLRMFQAKQELRAVCSVGCCYHLLSEEFEQDTQGNGVFGFPMSQYLREQAVFCGRNARMSACLLPMESLFYRAVFHVILQDHYNSHKSEKRVGNVYSKASSFVDYVRRALQKLELEDSKLSDSVIQRYHDLYRSRMNEMVAFNMLKVTLAPCIEGLILLDRLCYLKEQMIRELVCGAVALLLYLNTLDADFCYDDNRAIKTNPDLLPETPWTNMLYSDFWGTPLTHSGSHKSFRPLCTLSFRINYALGGLEPRGYHLFSVGLHCCVTVLYTALCGLLLAGEPWSLLAGLLFASHPVHTEAVAGLVGRADMGAALCFLLSLLCYSCHCRLRPHAVASRWRMQAWLTGSLVAATAAMLWKEQGVTVLAVSAVYDICVRKNETLLVSLAWLAGWGTVLLAARLYWMGCKPPHFSTSDNPAANSPHFLTRTLTFLYLPCVNAWLLLCPHPLSFDWSMEAIPLLRNIFDWRNLCTIAFYTGFALLVWFGSRNNTFQNTQEKSHIMNGRTLANGHSLHVHRIDKHDHIHFYNGSTTSGVFDYSHNGYAKPLHTATHTSLPLKENMVVFSLGLLALPFLPATNLFFYVGFVVAERVLYIPSMGFCLLVTLGIRAMFVNMRRRSSRALILGCAAGLVLLYSLRTVCRNQDWQNEEMLYRSGISVNPAKAWGNLGNVLKNQDRIAEAEKAYRNALYYRGNMADMLYNLGLLLQESERLSEALHYYQLAIQSRPTLASAYLNIGIIQESKGKVEEAKATFQKCVSISDENLKDPHAHNSAVTSCLYNLGKLLHEQGQQEEALVVYKEAVKKMPRQFAPQSLYNMMGEAYMKLNKFNDAEHWYKESLKAKPDHIPAHLTYGRLLSNMGNKTQAEHYFLKAIELEPTKGTCYLHYEAAVMAEKAAELDSTEFNVVFSAAHILRHASLNEEAEKYYTKAAAIKPDNAAALMNLGAILHLNGKLAEAETHYLHALQLRPDDLITQSNLHKLRNVMHKRGLNTVES